MSEGALAGLPRLVRAGDEARWRGGAELGTAVAVAAFWLATWLVDQPVSLSRTLISAGIVLVPTLAFAVPAARRRVATGCADARRVPRAGVYETRAAARERRSRLAAIVLTGIVALMVFDVVTGGAGVMAGLVSGVLIGTGVADLVEGRIWRAAERERGTRLFVLVRSDALAAGLGRIQVVEDEPPLEHDPVEDMPSPFDLEV